MIRLSFIICLMAFACSCARESSPTGGPKDETPPVTYDSLAIPPNYSTNFTSKEITIPFNEFIKVNDPFRNILISPPLEEKPEIRAKGKSVYIHLKNNQLHPNTTYTFSFGESIEDITEGNKVLNLNYVFSTGPVLDSLIVTGKVINAFTLKPEEKIAVMLYKNNSDSLPYKTLPNYYTVTNKDGGFTITHIHEGNYKIFAVKDQNFNLKFDLQSEEIAFIDSLVTPAAPNNEAPPFIELRLFLEDHEKQYLSKYALNAPAVLSLIFNKPTKNPRLIPIEGSPAFLYEEHTKNKDSLKLWFDDLTPFDSLKYYVADGDSILDTISFETQRELKKTKSWDTLTFVSNSKANFNLYDTLKLTFNQPLTKIDTSLILFMRDSVPTQYFTKIGGSGNRTLHLWNIWKQQTHYQIKLLPKAVQSLYKFANDTITQNFKTQEKAYYANLIVDLVLPTTAHPYVLSLINEGGKMIDQRVINTPGKQTFMHLDPKKYTLKLLFDLNGNSRWDPGRYLSHIPPEKIIYYSGEISLQSGWDSEIQWITNEDLLEKKSMESDSLKNNNDTIPKK